MLRSALLLGVSFLAIQPAVHASILLNENFDGLTEGLTRTAAGAFSTINSTNIDIVAGGYGLCNGPESATCIDMSGTGGNYEGQLQSNMTFGPGNYLLSFDLIGGQRGHTAGVEVTFGDYDQTFTLASGDLSSGIVTGVSVNVTAATHLLFRSINGQQVGLLLDNVVVSDAMAPTPEPGTLILGVVAFLGSFVGRSRSGSKSGRSNSPREGAGLGVHAERETVRKRQRLYRL